MLQQQLSWAQINSSIFSGGWTWREKATALPRTRDGSPKQPPVNARSPRSFKLWANPHWERLPLHSAARGPVHELSAGKGGPRRGPAPTHGAQERTIARNETRHRVAPVHKENYRGIYERRYWSQGRAKGQGPAAATGSLSSPSPLFSSPSPSSPVPPATRAVSPVRARARATRPPGFAMKMLLAAGCLLVALVFLRKIGACGGPLLLIGYFSLKKSAPAAGCFCSKSDIARI